MKTTGISSPEASRNFAKRVDRVHYQNVTFALLKNGVPTAKLIPTGEKIRAGRDLAKILGKAHLLESETESWRRD